MRGPGSPPQPSLRTLSLLRPSPQLALRGLKGFTYVTGGGSDAAGKVELFLQSHTSRSQNRVVSPQAALTVSAAAQKRNGTERQVPRAWGGERRILEDFQPNSPAHPPPNPSRAEFPTDLLKIIPLRSIFPPSAKKSQGDLPQASLFWDAMFIEEPVAEEPSTPVPSGPSPSALLPPAGSSGEERGSRLLCPCPRCLPLSGGTIKEFTLRTGEGS